MMDEAVADKVESFFSKYHVRRYPKGQIIILNGDTPEYVYHLISGKVKEYDVTYRGDEVILNIFKPGAFFPMSHAINGGESPYIYEAEAPIEVQQAPMAEVLDFVKDNPDVLFNLLSRVYRGLDGLLGRMAYLMSGTAKGRLMYELVIEARRFGAEEGGKVSLSLTEKDLGARAGLSRETVSREAKKLKDAGYIEVKNKGVVINDLPALIEKLGQEM